MEMSGTILPVARMGDPILNKRAEEVTDLSDPKIAAIIQDMKATVDSFQGSGLAAPQVFIPLRIMMFYVPRETTNPKYQLTPEHDPEGVPWTTLINPGFEPLDNKTFTDWEGCLSVPGFLGRVERFYSIRYWGTMPDGSRLEREAHGFHARVFQHEYDHLDGTLYPARIKDMKDFGFKEEIVQTRLST